MEEIQWETERDCFKIKCYFMENKSEVFFGQIRDPEYNKEQIPVDFR